MDLAAQLRSNGSACAGDQDPASVNEVVGAIGCDMHLVPPEELFDPEPAQIGQSHVALDRREEGRQVSHHEPRCRRRFDELRDPSLSE